LTLVLKNVYFCFKWKSMPGHFTFTGHEWDDIIQYPDILLPGIEHVSVVYWSTQKDQLRALTRNRKGELIHDYKELTSRAEGKLILQKFRSVNKAYEWIRDEESPLLTEKALKPGPGSSDLFTEIQNTILVLRFRSEADRKYDVLMIYLSKDLNQFGPAMSGKVLSSENKSIIGHILYNYFKNIFILNRNNNVVLRSIKDTSKSINKEYYKLKEEVQEVTLGLEEHLIDLSLGYLQDLSEKCQREYAFTEEALRKLRSYRGNIRHLPEIIEQAVVFTDNILYEDFDGVVRVDAPVITFDSYQIDKQDPPSIKRIDSKESRSIQLLDKLEKAAITLKSRDIALTSSNIGGALPQPITAPAITDALKKHRTSIIKLLNSYPQKWEVIREEFRPIGNLFKKDKESELKEGIA